MPNVTLGGRINLEGRRTAAVLTSLSIVSAAGNSVNVSGIASFDGKLPCLRKALMKTLASDNL